MLMMIESSKSQDWPDGLAYVLWEKLLKMFKLSDQIAAAKQTVKLYALKLGKDVDPTVLEEKIASLESGYGIPISKEMKISAIMKAAGKYYSDTIQSETRAIKRSGGTVTCDNLIQAMTESFSICGNKELDSDNEDDIALAATSFLFNGNCNICGKQGHKASECCEKHRSSVSIAEGRDTRRSSAGNLRPTRARGPIGIWTILQRSVLKLKTKVEKSSFKHLISVMGMSH